MLRGDGTRYRGRGGGRWPVIAEKFDPTVVRQTSDASCVSACGEMVLKDRGVGSVDQATLLAELGSPAITLELAGVLNRLAGLGRGGARS